MPKLAKHLLSHQKHPSVRIAHDVSTYVHNNPNYHVSVGWYGAESGDTAYCGHEEPSTIDENYEMNVYSKVMLLSFIYFLKFLKWWYEMLFT